MRLQYGRGEPPSHDALEIGEAHGFCQIVVHPGSQAGVAVDRPHVCRHRDDRRMLARAQFALANFRRRLEAVHHRHVAIHEDQIVRRCRERRNGLAAVVDGHGGKTELQELFEREALIDGVVFDEQHAFGARRGRRSDRHARGWKLSDLVDPGVNRLRDAVEELRLTDRLHEIVDEADAARQLRLFATIVRGDQDERRRRDAGVGANIAPQFDAVLTGHTQIDDRHIVGLAAQRGTDHRGFPGDRIGDGIAAHRPRVEIAREDFARGRIVSTWQERFIQEMGEPFVFLSDEWYYITNTPFPKARHYGQFSQIENGVGMTRAYLDDWGKARRKLPAAIPQSTHITLVTATMAEGVMAKTVADLNRIENLTVELLPVVNQFFGPLVTVAGLLCGNDIIDAVQAHQQHNEGYANATKRLVLLPRIVLDNAGTQFLDDVTVTDFQERIGDAVVFTADVSEVIELITALATDALPSTPVLVGGR